MGYVHGHEWGLPRPQALPGLALIFDYFMIKFMSAIQVLPGHRRGLAASQGRFLFLPPGAGMEGWGQQRLRQQLSASAAEQQGLFEACSVNWYGARPFNLPV